MCFGNKEAHFRKALNLDFSLSWLPLTFHHRKSFEYEDAARLTLKQGPPGGKDGHSNLCHAYSDDNIYEDIVCKSKTLLDMS